MSRHFGSSSMQARGRNRYLPKMIRKYPRGRQAGLPLIMCPDCGNKRVVKLVVHTDEHGNRGRTFFKCPRNIKGLEVVPGFCGFYEWPREYLAILVGMGKIVMVLGEAGGGEQEADSMAVVAGGQVGGAIVPMQKITMEAKLHALVGAVKVLSLVLGAGVLVAAAYVFK